MIVRDTVFVSWELLLKVEEAGTAASSSRGTRPKIDFMLTLLLFFICTRHVSRHIYLHLIFMIVQCCWWSLDFTSQKEAQ
jgi:hypothetical protein